MTKTLAAVVFVSLTLAANPVAARGFARGAPGFAPHPGFIHPGFFPHRFVANNRIFFGFAPGVVAAAPPYAYPYYPYPYTYYVLSILPVTTLGSVAERKVPPRVTADRSWFRTEHCMSLCMIAGVRLCALVSAAMMAWPPCFADADPRNPVVVIVPQVRLPSQQPLHVPTQPALQWAPPPAMGLTPGPRSPAPRCYAGTTVCPLERPEQVGKGCSCNTASGVRTGRALIPPVRDAAGHPGRTDS
jgi:hypothetical protein